MKAWVAQKFGFYNPLKSVFRTQPSELELSRMLGTLNEQRPGQRDRCAETVQCLRGPDWGEGGLWENAAQREGCVASGSAASDGGVNAVAICKRSAL